MGLLLEVNRRQDVNARRKKGVSPAVNMQKTKPNNPHNLGWSKQITENNKDVHELLIISQLRCHYVIIA